MKISDNMDGWKVKIESELSQIDILSSLFLLKSGWWLMLEQNNFTFSLYICIYTHIHIYVYIYTYTYVFIYGRIYSAFGIQATEKKILNKVDTNDIYY